MQTEKLVLTRPIKQVSGGHYWYTRPGSVRYTQEEMLEVLLTGTDIEFHNGQEEQELMGILSLLEKGISSIQNKIDFNRPGDVDLMNRIIRAGGFTKYLYQLEHDAFITV